MDIHILTFSDNILSNGVIETLYIKYRFQLVITGPVPLLFTSQFLPVRLPKN